jgi:hypothetical protein
VDATGPITLADGTPFELRFVTAPNSVLNVELLRCCGRVVPNVVDQRLGSAGTSRVTLIVCYASAICRISCSKRCRASM